MYDICNRFTLYDAVEIYHGLMASQNRNKVSVVLVGHKSDRAKFQRKGV